MKLQALTQIRNRFSAKRTPFLFESGIYTKLPEDLGAPLSLALMDIAGAPAQVAVHAKAGDTVVVEGAGKAGLLCLAEAKKRVSPTGLVVCMEYSAEQCELVRSLGIADLVVQADGQKPLKAYEAYLKATGGRLADFSVNTVNVPNTELSSILVTKDTGMIYFFSMEHRFCQGVPRCRRDQKICSHADRQWLLPWPCGDRL